MNSLGNDRVCSICGGTDFSVLGIRADNMKVLLCNSCKMGVVEKMLDKYYNSYDKDYYASEQKHPSQGYVDYELMAEHGVSWAEALMKCLRPAGKVLDIGCVAGDLLQGLGEEYETFGIEASTELAKIAEKKGIQIIGHDILNQSLIEEYASKFDLISSIAVYEHVKDFKLALQTSLKMLKDDGILLFEVPVISRDSPNEVWFNTSLEHIYYPTVDGLHNLFEQHLNAPLVGSELVIRDYASVFIGLTSLNKDTFDKVKSTYERLTNFETKLLSQEERRAQLQLKVIHAAETSTELLEYIHEIFPQPEKIKFLTRCIDLWKADVWRLQDAKTHIRELEEAKKFHYNQAENYRRNWESLLPNIEPSSGQKEP